MALPTLAVLSISMAAPRSTIAGPVQDGPRAHAQGPHAVVARAVGFTSAARLSAAVLVP